MTSCYNYTEVYQPVKNWSLIQLKNIFIFRFAPRNFDKKPTSQNTSRPTQQRRVVVAHPPPTKPQQALAVLYPAAVSHCLLAAPWGKLTAPCPPRAIPFYNWAARHPKIWKLSHQIFFRICKKLKKRNLLVKMSLSMWFNSLQTY